MRNWGSIAAIACWLACVRAIDAAPIHVDFVVSQRNGHGKLEPGSYHGSWSLEDAPSAPGVQLDDPFEGQRLSSFELEWLGEKWTPRNVRLARLELGRDGKLRSWIIGGTLVSGGCAKVGRLDCVGVPTKAADFYLVATQPERGSRAPSLWAVGVAPGVDGFIEAHGDFTVRQDPAASPRSSRKRRE